MKVTIYHNVTRDENNRRIHFSGYETGHEIVPVFEYDDETVVYPRQAGDHAFVLFNAGIHARTTSADKAITRRYRERGLRSLLTGDVVVAGEIALAVESVGFATIDNRNLNVVHRSDHGTNPLSSTDRTDPPARDTRKGP